jgi:ribonuclease R
LNKADYETKCEHSSEREKRAADAERASIKYKQVEFMASAEKKVFEGLISGVTEWGIYVEIIETKCEGMIRLSDMNDDFYEFDERNYRLVGRRNRKIYTLGDKVKVLVKKTDIDKRLIDLVIADDIGKRNFDDLDFSDAERTVPKSRPVSKKRETNSRSRRRR